MLTLIVVSPRLARSRSAFIISFSLHDNISIIILNFAMIYLLHRQDNARARAKSQVILQNITKPTLYLMQKQAD